MTTAIMAPVLIAITGLSVDVGYWYQQQGSVQSAADAAVLAAANAAITYSTSISDVGSFATSTGTTFAVAAANQATDSQFNFASSGSDKIVVSATVGTSSIIFTATATIPRNDLFSRIHGIGVASLMGGSQSASAEAGIPASSFTACGYTSGTITVTGGATYEAANCGIYAGSTTCPSITVSGSGKVIGEEGVDTPASCVATNGGAQTTSTTEGSGYIGTQTTSTPDDGDTSATTTNVSTITDPLAGLNSSDIVLWDPGITVASAPSTTTTAVNISADLSSDWNPHSNTTTETYCDTTYGSYTIPDGSCLTNANVLGNSGYLTGMDGGWDLGGNAGTYAGYTLLANTTGGQTVIEGGFDGSANTYGSLRLDDSAYYISGGFTAGLPSGGYLYFGSGSSTMNVTVTGGLSVNNSGGGAAIFYPGSYTISQAAAGGTPSNYAMTISVPSVTLEGGIYQFAGGMTISSDEPTTYMWSGLYEFEGASSNYASSCSQYYCGSGAFYGGEGAITFGTATTPASSSSAGTCGSTPSTWFFNGGLVLSGGTTDVTFCPGIYYVKNGDLYISSGTTVTGTGVTFVLEGDAGFIFNGGATINLAAPTSDCVSISAYPETAYNGTSPYDGTDGEGICGIAIYQERGNTASDYVDEGAGSTFTGGIYAPSAPLTISGAGALNITSSGVPSLVTASVNDSGSGNVTLTENNPPSGSGSDELGNVALLIQ